LGRYPVIVSPRAPLRLAIGARTRRAPKNEAAGLQCVCYPLPIFLGTNAKKRLGNMPRRHVVAAVKPKYAKTEPRPKDARLTVGHGIGNARKTTASILSVEHS
jgi:hypothetical protein